MRDLVWTSFVFASILWSPNLVSAQSQINTKEEESLILFDFEEAEAIASWDSHEGVGVYHACGGPFKPALGEFVFTTHGCDLGRVTDRISVSTSPQCLEKISDAARSLSVRYFEDLGYFIHGEDVSGSEWPIDLRKKTNREAWQRNNWHEIHYGVVDFRFDSRSTRASIRFQVLAGPQDFEDEMNDLTSEPEVKDFYTSALKDWTKVLRYLHNQFTGFCSPNLNDDYRHPRAEVGYLGGSYEVRFVASNDHILRYFNCWEESHSWCPEVATRLE